MFIVIMSDIHNGRAKAKQIISNCKRADLFIFLGDGLNTFTSLCEEMGVFHTEVQGNCDIFSFAQSADVASELLLDLSGKKVLCCHGHKYSVKHSNGLYKQAARLKGADIALYGHTHEQVLEYVEREGQDPLIVINPGSVGDDGSFATVDIRNSRILANLTRL